MIPRKKLPDQSVLRSLLYYANGNLHWKETMNGFAKKDAIAGSKNVARYRTIKINHNHYLLHRVIWKYFNNTEPDAIDHINGNIMDNSIENLQPITASLNKLKGHSLYKNNTSGCCGVRYVKEMKKKKWRAIITSNKRIINLGYFKTKELAIAERNRIKSYILNDIKL